MIPTKERLAQVLHAAGLFEMEKAARAGRYDDFGSSSATPALDLIQHLQSTNKPDLVARAMNGEWDATKEEAEAWYRSEGKDLIS